MAKLSESLENYTTTYKYGGGSVTLYSPNGDLTKDLIIYADGDGNPDYNTVELASFLNDNPKSIMQLIGSINKGTVNYRGNFDAAVDKYVEVYNGPINLNIIGFSGGTTDGIKYGCEQAQKVNADGTPRCESISVNVISTAYGYMHTNELTDADYQALANANGKVIFYCHDTAVADVGESGQKTFMSNATTMKQARVTSNLVRNSVPTYVVETHYLDAGFTTGYGDSGHANVNQTVMKYFIPMLYGEAVEGVDKFFDIEIAVADENGNIIGWEKVNSNEIMQVFSNVYMQEFKEKYSDLENISTSIENSALSSSILEVYNGMLEINNVISNTSSIFKLDSPSYDDRTCSIPKNLSNSVESLFNISRSVMNSLSADTEAICSIAQYINDMDKSIAISANELSSSFYQQNEYTSFKEELDSINIDIDKVDISMFSINNVSGFAGRASSNEIMDATKSLVSSLDLEINDSMKMKTSIDDFISQVGSENLLGEVWNKVSDSLSKYSSLMDIRSESASTLSEALKIASAYVIDYIGDEGEIDDSKIPELENNIKNLKQEVEELEQMCSSTHTETSVVTAADGTVKIIYEEVPDYSESAIANFRTTIAANKEAIEVLEEKLNKYKGLADVINKAQKIIDEALNCIKSNYSDTANDIENINNFEFNSDGINYASILGADFNKEYYINKYDNYEYINVEEEIITDTGKIEDTAFYGGGGGDYYAGYSNSKNDIPNVMKVVDSSSKQSEEEFIKSIETPVKTPIENRINNSIIEPEEDKIDTVISSPILSKEFDQPIKLSSSIMSKEVENGSSLSEVVPIGDVNINNITGDAEQMEINSGVDELIKVEDTSVKPIKNVLIEPTPAPLVANANTGNNINIETNINDTMRTIGTIAAVSTAIGTSGIGVYSAIKDKEDKK